MFKFSEGMTDGTTVQNLYAFFRGHKITSKSKKNDKSQCLKWKIYQVLYDKFLFFLKCTFNDVHEQIY